MDKNTVTGLVLIGAVLIGFSYFNRPTEQQIAAQRYQDSIAAVQQQNAELEAKTQKALANETKHANVLDTTNLFFNASKGEEKVISIQNEVVKLEISNKGGRITSAFIKDYKEQNRTSPVQLFNEKDADMNFFFYSTKEGAIQSKDYYFIPVDKTENGVTMRLVAGNNSYIDFIYKLNKDSYLVDFDIKATGMSDLLSKSTDYVDIKWNEKARQIEKGYTFSARLSELTYKHTNDDVDNLSSSKDDDEKISGEVNWIAYKNQFFSAVFIANQQFKNVNLQSLVEKEGSGYIKDYSSEMNTFFDPTGKQATSMHFYFGPNHYKTLTALDDNRVDKWELDRLVYLGIPIIRWVNKYFTINVFDWLTKLGLSMGLVLLILTIVVKAVVYPATWKTFISSAKMRVLKPKIQEITNKYPKQEDAMKKQQETMMLYKQYGVSPMGGCLPMLLQFPILISLFMFVPSAIELRQESFLWASDLSTYDAFITFPFDVPLLGDHLSLFCLLMTITNVLNSKYTMSMQDNGSQPQMPAMKWMMMLMPVMFLFILNKYPAGLNYYYFLSTLISVATTIILYKTTDNDKLLADLEANKKDPKQMKATGFAARLEAMQKQQEELKKRQGK